MATAVRGQRRAADGRGGFGNTGPSAAAPAGARVAPAASTAGYDQVVERSIADLGQVIRRRRQAAGLSVKELAEETGYSGAYISQVEKGSTLPSLSALATIAVALGSDIDSFFPSQHGRGVKVNRASDVNKLRMSPNTAEEYTILSSRGPGTALSALIHRAYPQADPPVKFRNAGERFALVLHGEVRFTFDGETCDLAAGDTACFSSQIPYSMEIISNGPAEIFWVVSPAIV